MPFALDPDVALDCLFLRAQLVKQSKMSLHLRETTVISILIIHTKAIIFTSVCCAGATRSRSHIDTHLRIEEKQMHNLILLSLVVQFTHIPSGYGVKEKRTAQISVNSTQ